MRYIARNLNWTMMPDRHAGAKPMPSKRMGSLRKKRKLPARESPQGGIADASGAHH
jgi:hypothetical protein